jgi:hypothetical protein
MHIYTDATGRDFINSESKIATGVDTRALGGYAIVPSGPQSGYRWLSDPDTPLPPAPAWVDVTQRPTSNFESIANGQSYQGPSPFGNFMLDRACNAIRTAPDGKQERTLNGQSFLMGRYVGGGLLEREPAIAALVMVGLKMVDYDEKDEWTEKEIQDKVEHAVDAGMLKPWDDGQEAERQQVEIREFLKDPQYVQDLYELASPEDGGHHERQELVLTSPQVHEDNHKEDRRAKAEPKPRHLPSILDAGDDIEKPPPRAWLLGNVFCREFLSFLFGDGGIGKTALR